MGIGPIGIGEIGERLRRSTVLIRSGNTAERRSDSGSGIVWDDTGRDGTRTIVTNAHVARSGDLFLTAREFGGVVMVLAALALIGTLRRTSSQRS